MLRYERLKTLKTLNTCHERRILALTRSPLAADGWGRFEKVEQRVLQANDGTRS